MRNGREKRRNLREETTEVDRYKQETDKGSNCVEEKDITQEQTGKKIERRTRDRREKRRNWRQGKTEKQTNKEETQNEAMKEETEETYGKASKRGGGYISD